VNKRGSYEQTNGWAAGVQVTGLHACSVASGNVCFPDIGIDVEISSETKIECLTEG
jgi:hypothetical protein